MGCPHTGFGSAKAAMRLFDSSLILHLVPVSDRQPFCTNGEGGQREASFRFLGVSMDLQGSSDNPQENRLIVFCQ